MSKRRLLFCNLKYDLPECNQEIYSKFILVYGLGIIQEIATQRSIPFDYYDTYISGSTDTFFSYYREKRHDVVLFSAISGNLSYTYLDYVFRGIKSINPSAVIVLGGPITSVYPEFLLEEVHPDIIVIGEGEETFVDLCAVDFSLDSLSTIEGIGYYTNENEYIINTARKPLPSPLENKSCNPLFQNEVFSSYVNKYIDQQKNTNRGWEIYGSRGCTGNCGFCKKVFDKPVRFFSAEYIINTMTRVGELYGMDRFNFLDENFFLHRRNFEAFLSLLEERDMNVKWRIRARVDHIPFDLLDRMQRLGLYGVVVGVESASQDVLDYYNKLILFSEHKENLRELSQRKLLFASFIVGAPIESEASIKENVEFIRYTGLTRENIAVSYLTVIPGTRIYEQCLNDGSIKSQRNYLREYMGDFTKIELNISPLSNQRLIEAREEMFEAAEANS